VDNSKDNGCVPGKSGAASVNGIAANNRHRKSSRTTSLCEQRDLLRELQREQQREQRQNCKFGFHLAVPMGKRTPGNKVLCPFQFNFSLLKT